MTTIAQTLTECSHALRDLASGAQIDARVLLCHVLNCNSAHLVARPEQKLSREQRQRLAVLINQRAQGVPVAYLTGSREFWSLDLKVTPDTLIPRPETELLVETILDHFDAGTKLTLADLGTGTGAIALAIASERPDWHIVASDISPRAVFIARENARNHGMTNIRFVHSNWFERIVDQTFDIIVSNPPYVARHDPHLGQGDVRMEPELALVGGDDGLDAIRHITQTAGHYLRPGGCLLLEHGYDQQDQVKHCFEQAGFESVTCKHDLAGQPRVTSGRASRTTHGHLTSLS